MGNSGPRSVGNETKPPGLSAMGSTIAETKVPSSWNALETIEAFTVGVERQLERLPGWPVPWVT